jgi:putative Holliday junction resolvase
MRILAIDPGEKRVGLAISDPTGTIARPLTVILHESRKKDADRIIGVAKEKDVGLIIIGQALDSEGNPGPAARKAMRLAEVIKSHTTLPVLLWDESESTLQAKQIKIELNEKKREYIDDLAAAVILQSYIETQRSTVFGNQNDHQP